MRYIFFIQKIIFTAIAFLPASALAQDPADQLFWGDQQGFQIITGLGAADPRQIIANLINILLGFLGILAVVIIILAGFKWMTSGGNEEKASEAKSSLAAAIIGILIILASFAIAQFVISSLFEATT